MLRVLSNPPPPFDRVQADRWLPLLLAVPLGLLAVLALPAAIGLPEVYQRLLEANPAFKPPFLAADVAGLLNLLGVFTGFCAVAWLAGLVLALVRRPWALGLVRKLYLLVLLWSGVYLYVLFSVTGLIHRLELPVAEAKLNSVSLFWLRWDLGWPSLLLLGLVAGLYVIAWQRVSLNVYARSDDQQPERGDRVIENIRHHGSDPRYRQSWLSSCGIHIFVIILLPFLLQLIGCVDPYRVPHGSGKAGTGDPVVALVKLVKPKKKEKKKYIVRPDAAIYFHVPDLDESELMQKVQEVTQLTYKVDPSTRTGRGGRGGAMGRGGGDQGGWPEGMKNGVVRFIRLEYNGAGWEDGMDDVSRADMNFLAEFKKITGFRVASKSESHPIRLLKKYDKGFAPPFVYMTGHGGINLSAGDIKILREYLLDGGMLFADCGSPGWDRSFRAFAKGLFPAEPLRTIADDDPIFQQPYTFANGAPPLWHHGGTRALGIKHKNRWCLFYHPGDINDAWKTGHSGLDPELAKGAMEMGVNIIYYAFTHYLELTAKYRK